MPLKDFVTDTRAEFLEDNILLIKDFLPQDIVKSILDLANSASEEDWNKYPIGSLWKGRLLEFSLDKNLISNEISAILNYRYKFIATNIVRKLLPGDERPAHYDSEKDPSCEYGIVMYLNDDFEGGEIFYPSKGITHKPVKNSVLIHSAGPDYVHGIYPVLSGVRYYMTLFADAKAGSNEVLPLYPK